MHIDMQVIKSSELKISEHSRWEDIPEYGYALDPFTRRGRVGRPTVSAAGSGRTMGVVVDLRGAMGLGDLSLWSLDTLSIALVLGADPAENSSRKIRAGRG
jgi:hypothetical protein